MTPWSFFLATFVGLAFAAWPVIGKMVGAGGAWTSNMVIFGSLVTSLAFTYREVRAEAAPSWVATLALLGIGLVNGLAVLVYSNQTATKEASTAIFIILVMVLTVVFAPLLNYLINKETITTTQIIGIAVICLGIILVSFKDLKLV